MFRFLTAGESHGPGLTIMVEGLPAGLKVSEEDINIFIFKPKSFLTGRQICLWIISTHREDEDTPPLFFKSIPYKKYNPEIMTFSSPLK